MEEHIIEIVRFGVCGVILIIGLILMYKADDNHAMRRLSALLSAVMIYFNNEIGHLVYLVIGALIELWFSLMGLGFILICGVVVMILPVLWVISWMTRRREA